MVNVVHEEEDEEEDEEDEVASNLKCKYIL